MVAVDDQWLCCLCWGSCGAQCLDSIPSVVVVVVVVLVVVVVVDTAANHAKDDVYAILLLDVHVVDHFFSLFLVGVDFDGFVDDLATFHPVDVVVNLVVAVVAIVVVRCVPSL